MKATFDSTCSNDRFNDRWTSPCCYTELGNIGVGRHKCPTCDRAIECSIETYTSSVTTLVDNPDVEDYMFAAMDNHMAKKKGGKPFADILDINL